MDFASVLAEVKAMSPNDRLRLVEAIWDSINEEQIVPELTDAWKQELDRRLEEHEASPGDVIPWEEAKARVLARLRR